MCQFQFFFAPQTLYENFKIIKIIGKKGKKLKNGKVGR